jgi:hypothetical protein
MKIKKPIKYTINRIILSDTLPYETPLTFSNRHLYNFLNNNCICLTASEKKDKTQRIEFKGAQDLDLIYILKLLFQASDAVIQTEIKFDSILSFGNAVNDIIRIKGWTCFSYEFEPVPILKIKNKAQFKELLNEDSLKGELKKVNDSFLRYHTSSTLNIDKILCSLLIKYCTIHLEIEKLSISCSGIHAAFPFFKNFHVITKSWLTIKDPSKMPFHYRIAHKDSDYRELAIPHPKNQLEVIAFYKEYKELILYYCNQSSFTIRKPDKVASFIFMNDNLHQQNKGDSIDFVEVNNKEYETLKTFFTYKKYPNIHRFYEDYKYHRAEKKYNKMYKFDISKCFDSIYTHSVVWALYDKNHIKDNIPFSLRTFPGQFDTLMQNTNFGETNGILIGPEFSRIFSELILQSIDKEIEKELRIKDRLLFKTDYEVYRYVDDYFIFYNDESTKDRILDCFKVHLKTFKMAISESKSKLYEKPLITELTIAKDKIIELFENEIKFSIKKEEENTVFGVINAKCNSNNLITKLKIILSESDVKYKDIMNFTLALITKRVEKCTSDFGVYYQGLTRQEFKSSSDPQQFPFSLNDLNKKLKQENQYTHHILELLDFTFFIYAVNPRVNFTIRLCHLLSGVIADFKVGVKFFTGSYKNPIRKAGKIFTLPKPKFLTSNKELIFKKISDEVRLVLEKNKVQEYAQIESLYLLIILQELGKEFRVAENLLIKYFDLKEDERDGSLQFKNQPNYFVITVLLFYIRDAKPYLNLRIALKEAILARITAESKSKNRSTECILLLFDLVVCPYLDTKFKRELLNKFEIKDLVKQNAVLNFYNRQKYWFTKWDNFNFQEEITSKVAHEPY